MSLLAGVFSFLFILFDILSDCLVSALLVIHLVGEALRRVALSFALPLVVSLSALFSKKEEEMKIVSILLLQFTVMSGWVHRPFFRAQSTHHWDCERAYTHKHMLYVDERDAFFFLSAFIIARKKHTHTHAFSRFLRSVHCDRWSQIK